MKRTAFLVIAMLLASGGAFAAQSGGNAALALAAIVGERSPILSHGEKGVLAHFLAGTVSFPLPPGMHKIVVTAEKIACRMGNVAITQHSCELTFGSSTITVAGRPGQELLATLQQNGVTGDGAAGTIYYSVAPITCTVDPAEVQAQSGGGASCVYTVGP